MPAVVDLGLRANASGHKSITLRARTSPRGLLFTEIHPSMAQSSRGGNQNSRDASSASPRNQTESPSSEESLSALGRALRDIGPYLDLGWRLAGTTAGPPVIGFMIDLWLGTTPWLLLGGCVVGLLGAALLLKRLQGDLSA